MVLGIREDFEPTWTPKYSPILKLNSFTMSNEAPNEEGGKEPKKSSGGGMFSRMKNKVSKKDKKTEAEPKKQPKWTTMTDDKGKTYYVNAETGESTWDKPTELMSFTERATHMAQDVGAKALDVAEDIGEKVVDTAEDLGEAAAKTSVGQQATAGMKQAANSDIAQQAKKKANSAKNQAKEKMKEAKEKMRRMIIEKAVVVANKGIDNAVDGVATSMGKDPYMPRIIIDAVDSVVDDIRDDAKIFVRETIEDTFEKHDTQTKAKITATYAPCCKRIVTNEEAEYDPHKNTYKCNPWYWLRATILYTMTPNDRSAWWQLWQPVSNVWTGPWWCGVDDFVVQSYLLMCSRTC
jgi:hypothetical protein